MRKSSKLLAVLLTLCLLFGAITAIFASADGETENTLKATDNYLIDAERTVIKAENVTKDQRTYFLENLQYVFEEGKSYAKNDVRNFEYFTLDYDISTESNYPSKLLFHTLAGLYNDDGTAYNKDQNGGGYSVAQGSDGNWYLGDYACKPYENEKAKLNCTPGVYDHITVVCKIVKNEAGAVTEIQQYLYLNGVYSGRTVSSITKNFADYSHILISRFRATVSSGSLDGTVVIQNCAINYYTDSTLSAYASASKLALYDLESVVYNENYVSPDADCVKINGVAVSCLPERKISRNLNNGDTITINLKDLTNVSIPENVTNFKVVCENDATFSLDEASKDRFVCSGSENGAGTYVDAACALKAASSASYDNSILPSGLGKSYYAPSTNQNGKYWGRENASKSNGLVYHHVNSGNNTYVRIRSSENFDPASTPATNTMINGVFRWAPDDKYYSNADTKNNSYITYDFDFGTDAYAYTFTSGDNTYYVTAKTESEALAKLASVQGVTLAEGSYSVTYDLAYPGLNVAATAGSTLKKNATFYLFFGGLYATAEKNDGDDLTFVNGTNSLKWTSVEMARLYVYKHGDNWYMGTSHTGTANAVQLSNEIGVFQHITLAFAISNDGNTVTPHLYANGEYVMTLTTYNFPDAAKTVGQRIISNLSGSMYYRSDKGYGTLNDGSHCDKMYDKYSIAFDNMAVNYYKSADVNDDFNTDMTNHTALYNMSGVVCDENYIVPNGDKVYASVNGKYYYMGGAAAKNLVEGGTVKLKGVSIARFETELKEFTVELVTGTESFALGGNTELWRYVKLASEDGKSLTFKRVIDGQVMANVNLSSNDMRFNIYVPYTEGVDFVSSSDSYVKFDDVTKIGNQKYLVIYWGGRNDYLTDEKPAQITFSYTAEGTNTPITLEKTFAAVFSYIDYLTLAANRFDCGTDEAVLIRAIMEYREAFYKAYKPIEYAANNQKNLDANKIDTPVGFVYTQPSLVKAFYNIYSSEAHLANAKNGVCTCGNFTPELEGMVGTAQNTKDANGVDHLNDVTFGIPSTTRAMLMYVKTTAKDQFVAVTYTSYDGRNLRASGVSDSSLKATISGVHFADFNNNFTISIYASEAAFIAKEAALVSYNYSIFNYVAPAPFYADANYDYGKTEEYSKLNLVDYAPLVEAMKNLAIASENYKVVVKDTAAAE